MEAKTKEFDAETIVPEYTDVPSTQYLLTYPLPHYKIRLTEAARLFCWAQPQVSKSDFFLRSRNIMILLAWQL